MRFKQSPNSQNRVIAVAENAQESLWLKTVKHKSIRKGDERFVIAALRRWLRTPEAQDAENKIVEVNQTLASELMEAMTAGPTPMQAHQQRAHNARIEYGCVIAEANELSLKLHMGPFLVDVKGDTMIVRNCPELKYFVGENPKRAKAQLARRFIEKFK